MINPLENRDKIIVDAIDKDNMSVGELGKMFDISRERVCQIYYRITGHARGYIRKQRKIKASKVTKFICSGCGWPVSVKEGRYLHKYCRSCHDISQKEHRIMSLKYVCDNCKRQYHPLALSTRKSNKKFCSFDCYIKYKSNDKKVGT
jgi:predicted RNA-binding Zn-ribbon protein involved in translation (DUF1610 family)